MRRDEAISFLISTGKPITHTSFTSDEYVYYDNGVLTDENGYKLPADEFWSLRSGTGFDLGWSEYTKALVETDTKKQQVNSFDEKLLKPGLSLYEINGVSIIAINLKEATKRYKSRNKNK